MKRFYAFCALILASLGLFAMPASAQAAFQINPQRLASNGCQLSGVMQNSGGSYPNLWVHIGQYDTPPGPYCWLQIKVSYWSTNGTWYIYTSPWVGNPPNHIDWYGQQAIWWVDFNTNYGGNVVGYRYYAPGCNSSGCS